MKLAFYYHIPAIVNNDGIFVPGYFGLFLDSLADEVEKLLLFLHEEKANEQMESDYKLKAKNIEFINLGQKTPSWNRALFPARILLKFKVHSNFDLLIVRSPSPLAPYFPKFINPLKLIYMIVGDYADGALNHTVKGFRDQIIKLFLYHNNYLFMKVIQDYPIMVNSDTLFEKYKEKTKQIFKIKTTTLLRSDFFSRTDTCVNETIQLLYTGRIDMAKGLSELLDALAFLIQKNIKTHLNIVGWELGGGDLIKNELLDKATLNHTNHNITFHGFKSVGEDLNTMYRNADIYVLPSYHEGFPRTIWEAMANSLPVITTRVGSIPSTLTHLQNAYLINSKDSNQLAIAILEIIKNPILRQKLIKNGFEMAAENTLEIQTKKIIEILKNLIHE